MCLIPRAGAKATNHARKQEIWKIPDGRAAKNVTAPCRECRLPQKKGRARQFLLLFRFPRVSPSPAEAANREKTTKAQHNREKRETAPLRRVRDFVLFGQEVHPCVHASKQPRRCEGTKKNPRKNLYRPPKIVLGVSGDPKTEPGSQNGRFERNPYAFTAKVENYSKYVYSRKEHLRLQQASGRNPKSDSCSAWLSPPSDNLRRNCHNCPAFSRSKSGLRRNGTK